MSRGTQYLLLAGALALVAGVVYWAQRSQPQPPPRPIELAGLAWLPAEAGLVGEVDLAQVRQHAWLVELLRGVTGEEKVAPDYQAFVEATGFDYTRDLDRLWVGAFGPSRAPVVVGVAEGRFARQKILAYARQQSIQVVPQQGIDMYEVKTGPPGPGRQRAGGAPGTFAFAFLDDTHLAFASDSRGAGLVVDCWAGRAPAVGSEKAHREHLEQLAAGRQVWLVDELGKWSPPWIQDQQAVQALMGEAALGLRVSGEGLEVELEALCHQPRQAERLRDNLRIATLAGRLALGRQPDRSSQAIGEALGALRFEQEGEILRARVSLSPAQVAAILGAPAPAPAGP